MLLRHAAPSPRAGRRADGLTWMGAAAGELPGSSGSTGSAGPAALRHVSPVPPQAGPRSRPCRAAAAAGAKAGSPSAARPHTARGRALPNAHRLPGLPPGTAESKPSRGRKRPRGARHTTAPLGSTLQPRCAEGCRGRIGAAARPRWIQEGSKKHQSQEKQCHQLRDPRCPACCNKELISQQR